MAAKKTTAKNSKKKTAVKKTSPKKAVAPKKTSTKKEQTTKKVEKKVEKPIEAKTRLSETVKKDNSNNIWMIAFVVLLLVVLALASIFGYMYINKDADNNTPVDNNPVVPVSNASGIQLIVIEDPTCANCQVDLFVSQVEQNLVPDLVTTKISFDSAEGKKILEDLQATQVPVYLFTNDMDKRDDWAELAGAFIPQTLDGNGYYMLNPQYIPNKVMIEEPQIIENAVIIGDENAPVTIFEFTDFECPFCAIAAGNEELVEQFKIRVPTYVAALPQIKEKYVDTGKVKIVFYNNPIASLHPLARGAHLAALCANEQDKFVEYEEVLWTKRNEWTQTANRDSIYKQYATDLELDQAKFDECLDTKKYDSQIDAELALGQKYGVSGTPAFFIGKSFISGAEDFAKFEALIEAELAE